MKTQHWTDIALGGCFRIERHRLLCFIRVILEVRVMLEVGTWLQKDREGPGSTWRRDQDLDCKCHLTQRMRWSEQKIKRWKWVLDGERRTVKCRELWDMVSVWAEEVSAIERVRWQGLPREEVWCIAGQGPCVPTLRRFSFILWLIKGFMTFSECLIFQLQFGCALKAELRIVYQRKTI